MISIDVPYRVKRVQTAFRSNQVLGGLARIVEQKDTVVIGGGQAGLAISYHLTQQGRDHIVLEKNRRVGETWRKRWDSFTLVTPNWQLQLPGFSYQGNDPDGYLSRDDVVAYLEQYAAHFNPPIRFGVQVTAVEQMANGRGYCVQTEDTTYEATNVVVATGTFQRPKIPPFSKNLPDHITQIHTSEYRKPQALPDGAVLIVGSGQSGAQIAQELNESGREVYLAVGSAGRIPRRYRGRDGLWWGNKIGMFDKPVEQLPSPKAKFAANPQLSGKGGGREINLHQFARDGIVLLGRLQDIQGTKVTLAPDLKENLAKADERAANFKQQVDQYIEQAGLDMPPEEHSLEPQDGYEQEMMTELDLAATGIKTVIWATGYRWDYSWVRLPVFDEDGYPIQQRGISAYPGLYFLGVYWLHTLKSGLFFGVGEDAAHIAAHITERVMARV